MKITHRAGRPGAAVCAPLTLALFAAACAGINDADISMVSTANGTLHGSVVGTQRAFFGVPYAAAPVGALRWKAPQPAATWTGIREATASASPCTQPITDARGQPAVRGTEDCLYLNVHAPAHAKRLPVVVFVHGGDFRNGSGSDYDASAFSRKGNVIAVTINYRLGAFGFLAHAALSAEASDLASGQYGLLDQRFALEWARQNIAAFGGDPDNVTLAGESSGAAAVCAHLASPPSARLFAKAILQSYACSRASATLAQAQAEAAGATFAQNLGCTADMPACMRALSSTTLAAAAATERVGSGTGWAPATGGAALPRSPATVLRAGEMQRKPILLGTNREEYRVFVALQELGQSSPVSAAQYSGLVNGTFGAGAAAVFAAYPLAAYAAPDLAQSALLTDFSFACPAQTTALLLRAQMPTYAYEFDDPAAPTQVPGRFIEQRSYHGAELPYLFIQRQSQFGFGPVAALSASQQALSDQMIGYWTTFAATGNPNAAGLPDWPRFTPSTTQRLRLAPGAVSPMGTFAAFHQCAFWSESGV